jgi:hypothetical protein
MKLQDWQLGRVRYRSSRAVELNTDEQHTGIFILEGILTFVIGKFPIKVCCAQTLTVWKGAIAFFVLYDYPETAKFLSKDEKTEVHRRLEADRGALANEFDKKYIWDAFKDWKIWMNCIITVGIFTPLYSFSMFLPTLVRDLGKSKFSEAQKWRWRCWKQYSHPIHPVLPPQHTLRDLTTFLQAIRTIKHS